MAVVVEHEKRKHEILEKSLDIFAEEGYEDVTFQKIAAKCGITRTTLYIYFKNKREIFLWSIKQLTSELEESLVSIIAEENLSNAEKLKNVLMTVLDKCVENKKLFNVVLMYLLQLKKMDKDPGERVRRRILRLRHLMSKILIDGIKSGEFKLTNVKSANEMFYSLIEAAVFRLAILNQNDVKEMESIINLAIEGLKGLQNA